MIKEITITQDDFKEFQKYMSSRISKTQLNSKNTRSYFVNVFIFFASILIFLALFQPEMVNISKFHWPTALVVSMLFIVFIVALFAHLDEFRKKSIPKKNGLIIGNRIIEINESGIKEKNKFGTSIYYWKAVEEVIKHEGNVYILFDTYLGYIIPSSAFTDQDEMEGLAMYIQEMHNKAL